MRKSEERSRNSKKRGKIIKMDTCSYGTLDWPSTIVVSYILRDSLRYSRIRLYRFPSFSPVLFPWDFCRILPIKLGPSRLRHPSLHGPLCCANLEKKSVNVLTPEISKMLPKIRKGVSSMKTQKTCLKTTRNY